MFTVSAMLILGVAALAVGVLANNLQIGAIVAVIAAILAAILQFGLIH